MVLSGGKRQYLEKVSRKDGIISALAFDQRGALKKMIQHYQEHPATKKQMEQLKALVSEELTPYASSILLDPEFGLLAARVRDTTSGLLLAYEKTGYDINSTERLPDCLEEWSVKALKEAGAEAIKFLLYYDVDSSENVNRKKQAYIERVGSECHAEDLPFFLEILTYDEGITDNNSLAFARVKPHKVNGAMKVFSNPRFGVDVLKVEVPVNMNYVAGFAENEVLYSKEEAATCFREQDASTQLPYIYLSAGVSAELFQKTLIFAHEAGAQFNGVLCGRATWAGVVPVFIQEGENAARTWLRSQGKENIFSLDKILTQTAISWKEKVAKE